MSVGEFKDWKDKVTLLLCDLEFVLAFSGLYADT